MVFIRERETAESLNPLPGLEVEVGPQNFRGEKAITPDPSPHSLSRVWCHGMECFPLCQPGGMVAERLFLGNGIYSGAWCVENVFVGVSAGRLRSPRIFVGLSSTIERSLRSGSCSCEAWIAGEACHRFCPVL